MTSPSIKTTKLQYRIVPDNNIYIYLSYFSISLFLLLVCKPSFVLQKENLNETQTKLSYSKLIMWQLILCLPLVFYYIINY